MQRIRPAVARDRLDPLPPLVVAVAAVVLVWSGSLAIVPALVWVAVPITAWCLLRDRVRLWRTRHRGGHLVIAGDGTLLPLITGESRAGTPAIVLTRAAETRINRFRAGSADRTEGGRGLGGYLRRARMVLLAGPRDENNVAIAHELLNSGRPLAARELPLPVIIRVDDTSRHAAVEQALAGQPGSDHVHVRLVSLPALIARALVRANVVDRVERIGSGERLLVVVGLTAITEHYVLDVLMGGRFRDGRDLRVVVVGADPAAWDAFMSRWWFVEQLGAPTFITSAIDDAAELATTIAVLSERSGPPAAVIIDAPDARASIAALEAIDGVMLALDQVAPAYAVHAPAAVVAQCSVVASAFGGGDIADRGELLLYERQEATARAVHEFTLEGRLDDGEALGSCPEVNDWDALGETIRDESRLLVDLHTLKLRDIGARVVPGRGSALALEPDELAALADAEHHRLVSARRLSDPGRVSAPSLPETAPRGETERVRIISRLLARSGQHAVRDLRVLVEPGFARDARDAADALARDYPDRQLVFLGDLAEPDVRAALHALQSTGHIVQGALAQHLATLTAGLSVDEQERFRSLVRHADRIIVPRPGEPVAPVLAARAHRRLATNAPRDRERVAAA